MVKPHMHRVVASHRHGALLSFCAPRLKTFIEEGVDTATRPLRAREETDCAAD